MDVVELPSQLYEAAVDLWHDAGLTRPWNNPRDDLLRAVKGAESTVLACVDGERLIGTAMVGHDGHRGWAYYVAVRGERRGTGVGRALMQACEAWVSERQIAVLRVMVREDNAAVLSFYDSLGYERSNVTVLGRRLLDP